MLGTAGLFTFERRAAFAEEPSPLTTVASAPGQGRARSPPADQTATAGPAPEVAPSAEAAPLRRRPTPSRRATRSTRSPAEARGQRRRGPLGEQPERRERPQDGSETGHPAVHRQAAHGQRRRHHRGAGPELRRVEDRASPRSTASARTDALKARPAPADPGPPQAAVRIRPSHRTVPVLQAANAEERRADPPGCWQRLANAAGHLGLWRPCSRRPAS